MTGGPSRQAPHGRPAACLLSSGRGSLCGRPPGATRTRPSCAERGSVARTTSLAPARTPTTGRQTWSSRRTNTSEPRTDTDIEPTDDTVEDELPLDVEVSVDMDQPHRDADDTVDEAPLRIPHPRITAHAHGGPTRGLNRPRFRTAPIRVAALG